MLFSQMPKSININSFNAYFFFLSKTVPEYIKHYPSKFSDQSMLSKWDYLNLALSGVHSPLLYELYIIAKYKSGIINYDYDKFIFALKNIYNICRKINNPYSSYRYDYWISSYLESRIEKFIDSNNHYPHDYQLVNQTNFNKKEMYRTKISSSHYIKNNSVLKLKNKIVKKDYYLTIGHFKDKAKREKHNTNYKFLFKKHSNRSFRRKNKQLVKNESYDNLHNKLQEVSDIWDID